LWGVEYLRLSNSRRLRRLDFLDSQYQKLSYAPVQTTTKLDSVEFSRTVVSVELVSRLWQSKRTFTTGFRQSEPSVGVSRTVQTQLS
jgi:hypothetical protein